MRYVVCPVEAFAPGTRRRVEIGRRAVAVFNINGRFLAVRDVCPHHGAPLSSGQVVRSVTATAPGCYEWTPDSTVVRCPWHGWEYDLTTGQSWTGATRVRTLDTSLERGGQLTDAEPVSSREVRRRPGPYVAETVEVSVENEYVVIHLGA